MRLVFRQKAEFLIKVSTKFPGMVTIRNIEKTTVHFPFLLFIQFSAMEIRLVFSSNKVYDKLITMTRKKVGVSMLVGVL